MTSKQTIALIVIVLAYYYWHAKGLTAKANRYSSSQGSSGVNTSSSNASTMPVSNRVIPSYSSAVSGSGSGLVSAPVVNIGSLNRSPKRAAAGTGIRRGRSSSTWGGIGTGGISPTWPTTQVRSTKMIRVGSGQVQVPSYTAIPVLTRGPGGAGGIVNLGG